MSLAIYYTSEHGALASVTVGYILTDDSPSGSSFVWFVCCLDGINKIPKCRYGESDCYFTVSLSVSSLSTHPTTDSPPHTHNTSSLLTCVIHQDHNGANTQNVFKNMAVEVPLPP